MNSPNTDLEKPRRARKILRRTLIVVGLGQVVLTAILNVTLVLTVIASFVFIGMGLFRRSPAFLGLGTILNLTLLLVFRRQSRTGLGLILATIEKVIGVVFRVLILAYFISAIALVIGGIWVSQFNLTVVGFVLSIPIILYLHSESPTYSRRGWILPPEEHLLTNRLKSQNEVHSDGQKLWRE